jgi:hypothetical protein
MECRWRCIAGDRPLVLVGQGGRASLGILQVGQDRLCYQLGRGRNLVEVGLEALLDQTAPIGFDLEVHPVFIWIRQL